MIIFARAPGTTGWVEIKPEEELSHRGQFWEIRKFAVESDDALPLARRLDRAEQALRAASFKYHGPSEKWLGPVGLGLLITDLEQRLAHAQSANGRWARGMEYVGGLEKQIADMPHKAHVTLAKRVAPGTAATLQHLVGVMLVFDRHGFEIADGPAHCPVCGDIGGPCGFDCSVGGAS